jgi:flagellin
MSSVACPLCGGDDLRHNFRRDDGSTRECVKITAARIEDALESAVTENTTVKGYVNQMEITAQTLSASVTNLSNSLGKITDTDYAAETSYLAKSAIISKASTALLAQGDQDHQLVSMLLD